MKQILKLYAQYNRDMNKVIIELLSNLSEEELKKERKIYFKSIYNLFSHLVRAGFYYQMGIQIVSQGKYCAYVKEIKEHRARIESSFMEAVTIIKELDEGFITFINELYEDDLAMRMNEFKMYNGRIADVSIWEIITQHITHQIHHRGQLSQVLDELNIKHDIGNIWPYVSDS